MGIEPTRPAWKAGILAIELHPQIISAISLTFKIIADILSFVNPFFKFFLIIEKNIKNYCVFLRCVLEYKKI